MLLLLRLSLLHKKHVVACKPLKRASWNITPIQRRMTVTEVPNEPLDMQNVLQRSHWNICVLWCLLRPQGQALGEEFCGRVSIYNCSQDRSLASGARGAGSLLEVSNWPRTVQNSKNYKLNIPLNIQKIIHFWWIRGGGSSKVDKGL